MILDDQTRALACRALLGLIGMQDLFTGNGPTPEALKLRAKWPPSTGDKARDLERAVILEMAFGIWDGTSMNVGIILGDLLRLDSEALKGVGEVLIASAGGENTYSRTWKLSEEFNAEVPARSAYEADCARAIELPDREEDEDDEN